MAKGPYEARQAGLSNGYSLQELFEGGGAIPETPTPPVADIVVGGKGGGAEFSTEYEKSDEEN